MEKLAQAARDLLGIQLSGNQLAALKAYEIGVDFLEQTLQSDRCARTGWHPNQTLSRFLHLPAGNA